jgi:RNA polymerase sigma-70 factor (ECF subfamily)
MKGAMEKQTFSTPRRVMVREVAMRAKECGDLSLLLRCQRGDVEAFGDIYEKYVDRVYRYICSLTSSPSEAEDLTAETFLRAWQAIGRYRWRGKPLLSWLLTIAHNLVVSHVRQNSRQGPSWEQMGLEGRPSGAHPEEETYIAHLQYEKVFQAILKLRPLERQVILLRFVDQMDYREVAAALGKAVNSIRVAQFRALRNLRRMLLSEMEM